MLEVVIALILFSTVVYFSFRSPFLYLICLFFPGHINLGFAWFHNALISVKKAFKVLSVFTQISVYMYVSSHLRVNIYV